MIPRSCGVASTQSLPLAAALLPVPPLCPRESENRGIAVSIDCRHLRERPGSIDAYVRALVDRLPALSPATRLSLWVDPRAKPPLSHHPDMDEHVVGAPASSLRSLFAPSRLVDLSGVDVLHAPFNSLCRGVTCPTVVTLHDPTWLDGVPLPAPFRMALFRDGMNRALRQATRLVATSRATADAITRRAPGNSRRIRVIPHGIDSRFRPPPDRVRAEHDARRMLGIPGPYLLVAQNTPDDSQRAVLEAFAVAELDEELHLVVPQRRPGRRHFGAHGSGALGARARQLGIAHRVVFTELVPDRAVVRLLQGARALVQLLRHEGSSPAALEALACGTPVVASDATPLVEALGGAALHVPEHIAELVRALERITLDRVLATELSVRGPERARAFSWDRSAALHLEVYREAAHGS